MIKYLFNRQSFCVAKAASIAVFNSKKYDVEYFNKVNAQYPVEKQVKLHYFQEELTEKTVQLAIDCDTVCCFVNDKINANVLRKLHLQGVDLVALRCAGFNNVDLKEANKLNMKVVRVPAYSPEAVAEFAMALLLALNRKIHKAYNRTRDHNFALDGLLGTNLHGKQMGLLGLGKIGLCMANICNGFGMNVIAYDVKRDPEIEKQYKITYVDESDLFYRSDFLSLHCPLTPQTKHIINEHNLTKMKDNVLIVNTGRGALIESKSVVQALKKKKIAGLALDVYEQEERVFFKDVSSEVLNDDVMARLLSFPNVILTGHQAFFTDEAINNICKTTLNNILDIRSTGSCINQIII